MSLMIRQILISDSQRVFRALNRAVLFASARYSMTDLELNLRRLELVNVF
jgi:hypothetical protein